MINLKNNVIMILLWCSLVIAFFGCSSSSQNDINNAIDDSVSSVRITSEKDSLNPTFEGDWVWEKNTDAKDFSLNIYYKNDILFCAYCCIIQSGAKMDCGENDDSSFSLPIPKGKTITTSFKSYFSNTEGKVKLTLDKGRIIWELIEAPAGEFYCPNKAIMIRG